MRHFGGPHGLYNLPREEQIEVLGMYRAAKDQEAVDAEAARIAALPDLIGHAVDDDAEARARHFQVV